MLDHGCARSCLFLTDRYDDVRSKSPREHELGREDLEWENNLREVFVDLVAEEGMQRVNLRLDRQIVRWGETNLFNIVNLPNPSDNSFQMFFQDPDDLAYSLWMARLNWNITGAGIFDNLGFDKDLHPKWIGTTSALVWSIEGYWKHIKNMPTDEDPSIYAADKKKTKIFSMFFMTDYHHGEIVPMLTVAYDTEGVWMINASVSYDPDGKWKFQITEMSFWGNRTPLSQYSVGGVMQDNSELSFRIFYRF